ncbi:MAG: DNA repair protein RecO [Gemmatimonadales bacterium]
MPAAATPAIILSALRYGDTSKIVRLATEDFGVQSAIAKGALRPKSRFGAALQVLSDGVAHLIVRPQRDLQLLTAFDLTRLRAGLTEDVERYAAAEALAELMIRFAPADAHPESFQVLAEGLDILETAPVAGVGTAALRAVWSLVGSLGFAPSLTSCVRDGADVPAGPLAFSTREGGALCAGCAAVQDVTRLPPGDRADLETLLSAAGPLPALDDRRQAAHRRLLSRYIHHHLGEGAVLPALDFWLRRPWAAA